MDEPVQIREAEPNDADEEEEEEEELEVFFGEKTDREQHKAEKYSNRRTALFNPAFRKDRKVMRYTVDLRRFSSLDEEEDMDEATEEDSPEQDGYVSGGRHRGLQRETDVCVETNGGAVPVDALPMAGASLDEDPCIEVLSHSLVQSLLPASELDDSHLFSEDSFNESRVALHDVVDDLLHTDSLETLGHVVTPCGQGQGSPTAQWNERSANTPYGDNRRNSTSHRHEQVNSVQSGRDSDVIVLADTSSNLANHMPWVSRNTGDPDVIVVSDEESNYSRDSLDRSGRTVNAAWSVTSFGASVEASQQPCGSPLVQYTPNDCDRWAACRQICSDNQDRSDQTVPADSESQTNTPSTGAEAHRSPAPAENASHPTDDSSCIRVRESAAWRVDNIASLAPPGDALSTLWCSPRVPSHQSESSFLEMQVVPDETSSGENNSESGGDEIQRCDQGDKLIPNDDEESSDVTVDHLPVPGVAEFLKRSEHFSPVSQVPSSPQVPGVPSASRQSEDHDASDTVFQEPYFSPTLAVKSNAPTQLTESKDMADVVAFKLENLLLEDAKELDAELPADSAGKPTPTKSAVTSDCHHGGIKSPKSGSKSPSKHRVVSMHSGVSKMTPRQVKKLPHKLNFGGSSSGHKKPQGSVFERLYSYRKAPQGAAGFKTPESLKKLPPSHTPTKSSTVASSCKPHPPASPQIATPRSATPTRSASAHKRPAPGGSGSYKGASASKKTLNNADGIPRCYITTGGSLNRNAISKITTVEVQELVASSPKPQFFKREMQTAVVEGNHGNRSHGNHYQAARHRGNENIAPPQNSLRDELGTACQGVCDAPGLLDDSILLQEKKVELEKLREQKRKLQTRIAQQNSPIQNGSSSRSPLETITADNMPRVRYKDYNSLSLNEKELDAMTMVHTLCNSQQVAKVTTKPTVTKIIKICASPREASKLQWQTELTLEDPVLTHSPAKTPVSSRKSILSQRSPDQPFPYSNQPPSPVVVRKSAKKRTKFGKSTSID